MQIWRVLLGDSSVLAKTQIERWLRYAQCNAVFSSMVDHVLDVPLLYLGFDLSLTRSAAVSVIRRITRIKIVSHVEFGSNVDTRLKGISEGAYLIRFGEWLRMALNNVGNRFVVIGVEGYSFRSSYSRFQESLGAVLRYEVSKWSDRHHGKSFCCAIPPVCIKKYFTGNHRADKKMMIAESGRRKFKPASDDEADAFAVASFLCDCTERVSATGGVLKSGDYIDRFLLRVGLDKMRFF